MKAALLCAGTALLCVAAGLGGEASLQLLENGKSLSPVQIDRLAPDGTVTEWVDYGLRGDCVWKRVFNCFSDQCGSWYLGETYCNLYVTNDMQFQPWFGGLDAERISIGWFWYVFGAGSAENCAIVIEFYEDFDDTCALGDDGLGGFLGGVVLRYGPLDSGAGAGYYFSDVDLCGLDWLKLPQDGAGAYSIYFATYDDANPDELMPATCAQPMLLACNPPQSPIQWDDDSPPDWTHQVPDECYDYTWTYDECPAKLLQAALAADIDVNQPCWCVDFDGDCDTDQADLGIFLANWGCTGNDCVGDLDQDGVVGQSDLGIFLSSWGCSM